MLGPVVRVDSRVRVGLESPHIVQVRDTGAAALALAVVVRSAESQAQQREHLRFAPMARREGLEHLTGYPFEVRYSDGALLRAKAAADVAEAAFAYFRRLFSSIEPDIALIVADETDWSSHQPYGLPFFNDDAGQIRRGVVVMPAGSGDFWTEMVQDIRETRRADTRNWSRPIRTAREAWTCSRSSI